MWEFVALPASTLKVKKSAQGLVNRRPRLVVKKMDRSGDAVGLTDVG